MSHLTQRRYVMRTIIKKLLVVGFSLALIFTLSLFASTTFGTVDAKMIAGSYWTSIGFSWNDDHGKVLSSDLHSLSIWNPVPPPGLPRVVEASIEMSNENKGTPIWNPVPPPGLPRMSIWNPVPPPGLPRMSIWNPVPPPGLPRMAIWNPVPPPGLPRVNIWNPVPPPGLPR